MTAATISSSSSPSRHVDVPPLPPNSTGGDMPGSSWTQNASGLAPRHVRAHPQRSSILQEYVARYLVRGALVRRDQPTALDGGRDHDGAALHTTPDRLNRSAVRVARVAFHDACRAHDLDMMIADHPEHTTVTRGMIHVCSRVRGAPSIAKEGCQREDGPQRDTDGGAEPLRPGHDRAPRSAARRAKTSTTAGR